MEFLRKLLAQTQKYLKGLALSQRLAIGACVGRVIRVFETGFAVKFVERQNVDDLSRLIVVQPRGSAVSAQDRAGGVVEPQSARCA